MEIKNRATLGTSSSENTLASATTMKPAYSSETIAFAPAINHTTIMDTDISTAYEAMLKQQNSPSISLTKESSSSSKKAKNENAKKRKSTKSDQ